MIEHDEVRTESAIDTQQEQGRLRPAWSWGACGCLLAYIACLALMIAPNYRVIGSKFIAPLQISQFLVSLGAWLPSNFHWLPNASDSFTSTNNGEFLFFIVLAFIFYGAAMLFLRRLPAWANYARIQAMLWGCVVLAGIMLVFAPFMLSHDVFVYADYGNTILTTHANLYFTTPISVSNSYITHLDDWNYAVTAYGPLWLGITIPVALVSGSDPLRYIISFRVLALCAHLINTWLVLQILRASGRSPRTVMLGTLLYALNPLMLIESALGAHNDTEMITFLLLGILLCLRAEQRGFARFIDYVLPAVAFTLAILIKYTSLPVLVLYLALLVRKSWPVSAPSPRLPRLSSRHWAALLKASIAGVISAGIALLAYAPFWIGHSLTAIVYSFGAPPSARFAENSILRSSWDWIGLYGRPPAGSWQRALLEFVASHSIWNIASIAVVLTGTLLGIIMLWRRPVTHTLTAASLFTLGALLVVTPWLFAWYVTWLIALAALLVGQPVKETLRNALIAFAIAFSISIYITYIDKNIPVLGPIGFVRSLYVFGIPVLVFLLALLVGYVPRRFFRSI
jgi:hypothetical protein